MTIEDLLIVVLIGVLIFGLTSLIPRQPKSYPEIYNTMPSWGIEERPDGTLEEWIYFVSNRDTFRSSNTAELYRVPPEEFAEEMVTRLTTDTFQDVYPSCSPDGRKLAYISNRHGQSTGDLYIFDVYSKTHTRITYRPNGRNLHPCWVPVSDEAGNYDVLLSSDAYVKVLQLYRIKVPTKTWTQLTYSQYPIFSPAVSPDGQHIAFTVDVSGDTDIYLMKIDGTEIQQITAHPGRDERPSWSPDGQWIAFQTDRDGNWDIYIVNPWTREEKPLTRHTADDIWPTWRPKVHEDGKLSIAFQSMREGRWDIYVIYDVWGEIEPVTGEPSVKKVTGTKAGS
ncbi:hypothetical protein DRN74_07130 [Candidatus Micrarchaeota archaeon]|nr:MAG: hypothetical protein DRN74_07130 [Candidatus Micrarchaeota archaeon]